MNLPTFITHRLKKVLRRVGYGVRRASSRDSLSGFLSHLSDMREEPRTIIDVGVADGTPELYEAFSDARFVLVEPLREFGPYIERICDAYDATWVKAAAGRAKGVAELHIDPSELDGASLLSEMGRSLMVRQVPVVTLDGLNDQAHFREPILLKVDVQGAELEVLKGAKALIPRISVVILEVSFFRFQTGCPDVTEAIQRMSALGFVPYDLWDPSYRPQDNALGQIDIAFVPVNSRLRTSHSWQ